MISHRSITALCLLLLACVFGHPARAAEPAAGSVVARIGRVVHELLLDPVRPRIYGTTTVNTVIAIDTRTRAIAAEIPIGSNPVGLDISPDGTRLYVANSGSTAEGIAIVDLNTFTKIGGLPTPAFNSTVAAGLDDRLYITDGSKSRLIQISAVDGSIQQTFGGEASIYASIVAISPDRATLFCGNRGLSPASLARYDVSADVPVFKEKASNVGSNGQHLVINRAGTRVCYSTGSGQGSYGIALLNAANVQQTYGLFNCGAYPGAGAFSPDGTRFYTTPSTQNVVKIYDTATYVQTGSFNISSVYGWLDVNDLATSHRGGLLYVADENEVVVYTTGTTLGIQFTSSAQAEAHQEESFSFQATASQPELTFSATGLPAGLTISPAGLITGTPTVAGTFPVTITAADPEGVATQNFTLTVLAPFTVYISGQGAVTDGYLGTTWRKVGAPFSITATPAEGFAFSNWSGASASATATILGVVQEKMVLTANFLPTTPVSISVSGPGEVTPGLAGTTHHIIGASLSVSATPSEGARFLGWTGSIPSDVATLDFVVEPGLSLVANFEMIPTATVTVTASGPGTVTPAVAGTTVHQIGTALTVEATPGPGARFLGWAGSIASTAYQLPFSVQADMSLVANFEAVKPYAGRYRMLTVPEATPDSRTSITLQLGSAGAFTAVLKLNGVRHLLTGDIFDPDGFTASIPRGGDLPPAEVHFAVSKIDDIPRIQGSVDFGDGPIPIEGFRLGIYSAASPPADAGKYTWGAPPAFAFDAPGGASFGSARVAPNGNVYLSGVLGDGTPFATSAKLAEGGFVLLEVPLYANKGTLNGILQFRDIHGQSDFDGTFAWHRPARPLGLFSQGFRADLEVIGSRMLPLSPQTNLFSGTTGTFEAADVPANVLILPANKVRPDVPDMLALRLQIKASAHSFSGSFLPLDATARKQFRGKILIKSQRAFGHFRNGADFGAISLAAF